MREPLHDGLDAEGHVRGAARRPREIARALVELGQMQRPEGADAREDATGAADLQVGAPHVGPAALEGDAARERVLALKPLARASAHSGPSRPGMATRKISKSLSAVIAPA